MAIRPLEEFPFVSNLRLPTFLARYPDPGPEGNGRRQIFFQEITLEQYRYLQRDIRLSIGFGKLEDHHEIAPAVTTLDGYSTFATDDEAEAAAEAAEAALTMYVGCWLVSWDSVARLLFTEDDIDELHRTQVMRPHEVFPPFYDKMCSTLVDYLNGQLSQTGWRAEYYETLTPGLCVNAPVPLTGFELGRLSLGNSAPFQLPLWRTSPIFQL